MPPGQQFSWQVSGAFLAAGAVFAFANASRPLDQVLLRNLFDNGTRCGIGELPSNRVCLNTAGTVRPWVPWMSGQWNPYEACDVQLLNIQQGKQEEIWPYDNTVCPTCYEPQSPAQSAMLLTDSAAIAKNT